jgi:cytoplasmic iron level regulating protein YaaA (DUF328/UPF0246 family)
MLTLLSPAKRLDYDTAPISSRVSQPEMLEEAEYLIEKLKKLSARQIGRMMKISPALAELNQARYQGFSTPFSPKNAKQALLVFKGDVYTGLDAQSLTKGELEFAQRHLRILSGLYGLLRPLDLMQPYRLEMGSDFAVTPKKHNLYLYWGDRIARAVDKALRAQNDDVLINLASNEYFRSVRAKSLQARIITPNFKDLKNGHYKPIFLWVKQARGMMARFIIKNRLSQPEQLKDFDMNGYRYNEEMSTPQQWLFTRDKQP